MTAGGALLDVVERRLVDVAEALEPFNRSSESFLEIDLRRPVEELLRLARIREQPLDLTCRRPRTIRGESGRALAPDEPEHELREVADRYLDPATEIEDLS